MKTACITMFKNEAAILPAFLDQIKEFFDFTLLVDHRSNDRGVELVQQFIKDGGQAELLHLVTPGLHQSEAATMLVKQLFDVYNVDSVTMLDADEFLPFANKAEFVDFLDSYEPMCDVIQLKWLNLAPEVFDGKDLFHKKFLYTKPAKLPKITVFRSMYKKDPEFLVDQGFHIVKSRQADKIKLYTPEGVYLYHIPIRSRAHFMTKMALGAEAMVATPEKIERGQNLHIFYYLQRMDELYYNDEALAKYAMEYSKLNEEGDTSETNVLEFDFPYIKSIYNDLPEDYIFQLIALRFDIPTNALKSDPIDEFDVIITDTEGTVLHKQKHFEHS